MNKQSEQCPAGGNFPKYLRGSAITSKREERTTSFTVFGTRLKGRESGVGVNVIFLITTVQGLTINF